MNQPIDLGETTSIEILKSRIPLESKRLVDAGCGSFGFTQHLLDAGAKVLGIDPDPIQAEKNRSHSLPQNLEFVESGAEQIPCEDNSMDGLIFSFSLHHIDSELYPAVFAEIRRVLKPTGFLCVIEPQDCPLNDVMKLFHDEDRERAAAQQALVELGQPVFQSWEYLRYHSFTHYGSFEGFAEHFANQSFNELYTADEVYAAEVKSAYESRAEPGGRFKGPKLMFLAQGLTN